MHRASPLAAFTVLALAAAAVADEYTVTAPEERLYFTPPPLPTLLHPKNPLSVTEIIQKRLDAQTVSVALPFSFPYFGTLYDRISVSDDGWLAFGTTTEVRSANPTLPSKEAPNAVVAALWDRLATRKGDVRTFFMATGPVDPLHPELAVAIPAPNRVFVVAWDHVNTSDAHARDDLSFEVMLHEGTGVIEIAYSTAGRWNKLSYTAGIENETGTRGFAVPSATNTNLGPPTDDWRFSPNLVTVTGTITRDQFIVRESNLGTDEATNLPVVGADVVLVREDKEGAGAVIARTRTGADGAYSLTSYGIDGSPTFAVDLLCSGAESRVTNGSGVTYTRRIASGIVPVEPQVPQDAHLDAAVDALDPNFRPALNIQQAAHRGYAFAQAAIDASGADNLELRRQFPQLEIRWVKTVATTSGYTPASSTAAAIATISDESDVDGIAKNADVYDDDVVLREYAQHLLANLATFAGKLNAHVWGPVVTDPPTPPTATPAAAFLDGFSFWFAAAVQGRAQFIDTKRLAAVPPATTSTPSATVFDLETAIDPVDKTHPLLLGQQVAGSVAATLWDLVDPAGGSSDASDEFVGLLPDTGLAVFSTLDDRVDGGTTAEPTISVPSTSAAPTIASFFAKWRAKRTEAEAVASARLFIARQALDDDTKHEPNDRAGETTTFTLVDQRTNELVLNQSNTDRFSFDLGNTPLSLAFSTTDATQAEVKILDATEHAITLAATPSTTSPIVVTTPQGQATGTYVLQITWKSGPAAHYSIAKYTPPSLKTPLPPQWTVGLPFNRTLELSGGVAPAAFSLASGAVPGLSIQSAGTRYVGTPTTTGHYPLTLSVTDQSGAGPQLLAPFSLDVLEGLTLPSVFGVATGKPVSVDLGRGGIAPAWTLETAAPPAGLTLTAGGTLHLEGMETAASSFTVKASALDPPLNASLASKTSQVVVCPAFGTAQDSPPNASAAFGYWFDAIGGSRVTLAVRFSGENPPPFSTLIDDRGTPVQLGEDVSKVTASSVRIRNLVAPRTARYFLVFNKSPETFKGKVAAATLRVLPPRRTSRVGNVATVGATVESRFTAIAGSRATITIRSGPVPKPPKPGAVTLLDPNGQSVDLGSARFAAGGERQTYVDVPLDEHGEYVLTFGAEPVAVGDVRHSSTGPLLVEVVIVPPKRASFSID